MRGQFEPTDSSGSCCQNRGLSVHLRRDLLSESVLTSAAMRAHDRVVLSRAGVPVVLAQRTDDYNVAASASRNLAAARDYVEWYIGQGNLKWVLLGLAVVLLIFLTRRRR